jgi:ribosome hibernation promoting factor
MTLQVEIQGHDMEVTASLDEYVRKKAARLDRYMDTLAEARVELLHEKAARSAADRQVAQITVRGRNVLLRAEERSDDMFAAVDAAIEKLQRRLERYKGKRHRGRGDGTPASLVGVQERGEKSEPATARVVRRKAFELVPMSEEDAIEQMELLGHDSFFVFLNLRSNQVNVLYRRRDGTFGLIETQSR